MDSSGDPRPAFSTTIAALAADPRLALEAASTLGIRGAQLSGRQRGTRAKDLDGSGRRDLAAAARRLELQLTGIDFWIKGDELLDPSTVDRGVGELIATVRLAADLGGLPVSVRLPDAIEGSLVEAVLAAAERVGVDVVDHAAPPRGGTGRRVDASTNHGGLVVPGAVEKNLVESGVAGLESLLVGIDPPAWSMANLDVLEGAGRGIASLRLADLSADGMRVPVGGPERRFDPRALLAVARTGGFEGMPIIDARRWTDVPAGIASTVHACG